MGMADDEVMDLTPDDVPGDTADDQDAGTGLGIGTAGDEVLAGPLDGNAGFGRMDPTADLPSDGGGAVIGRDDDGGVWDLQDTGFTCAVVSQKMILAEFGIEVSEAGLMGEALENGWLTVDGTDPADLGELLELHGVSCHQGSGPEGMLLELEQGHKVIVGVDADELWSDSPISHEIQDMVAQTPNHALVIQGVRQNADGSWTAIVNDPGDPHGAGREYPLDQFMDAWQDSGCYFVATDAAPPGLSEHGVFGNGFDAAAGGYGGMRDWVADHCDWLADAARSTGIGLAASGVMPLAIRPSKGGTLTEKERNDRLRDA